MRYYSKLQSWSPVGAQKILVPTTSTFTIVSFLRTDENQGNKNILLPPSPPPPPPLCSFKHSTYIY